MERERKSKVWGFFTRKDESIATCNICNQNYSFRSSVSNLTKHLRNKHSDMKFLQTETDLSSSDSDGEQEKSFAKKRKPTWNYYEVLDSDKFEATCKLCSAGVNYDSVSDLVKHIREEHGEEPLDSDDDYEPKVQATKPRRMVSKTWNYYKIVDPQAKVATCLLCRKKFSYSATVSNLKRHLYRKHGEIVRAEADDGNKLIISSNGQLFEVATESSKILDSDDKEPLEMDTVYLEDLDESLDQIPPRRISTSSPKKKTTVPLKRNFSSIAKEQVNTRNTCSETEQPTQRHSTENMATLDYFGQYIVALLKELPKAVSDQLQHEIIKQILTSKMALESPAPNYRITIRENNIRNEYTNTREPVTVTVNEPIQSEITEVVINDGTAELPTLNEE